MPSRVFVIGVGMTTFSKPGTKDGDYPDWAQEAITKAIQDAKIDFKEIKQAVASYVAGDSTCGQRSLYQVGMSGIPVYNVNNACASGSTALYMAKQFIEGGLSDCVLAFGFEKMERGSLSAKFTDRTNPADKHVQVIADTHGLTASPMTAQMFGNAGREHMDKYGTTADHMIKIAHKNHMHSVNNPYAQFRTKYSMDDVKNSRMIHEPLTKLQCSPTSDGAAAAILANEAFVKAHGLEGQAVEILAQQMATDLPSTFNERSCIKMIGYDMAQKAADMVYSKSGVRPEQVDVIELHDCFSANELITYEALRLCPPGKAGELVDRGDNTYGGKYVVNPSGGLESKGHPLGATGLAQCAELSWQLRGQADKRQVKGAKYALQHNIGIGGAAVVTMYSLGFPKSASLTANPVSSDGVDGLKSTALLREIEKQLKKDGANMVRKIKGIYCFKIKAPGKDVHWIVDVKNGNGSVELNSSKKPECTLTMDDDTFVKVMLGQMDAQKAYFGGKLKIGGNLGLAMKLKDLQLRPEQAKL